MALVRGLTGSSKILQNLCRTFVREYSGPGPKALGTKLLGRAIKQDEKFDLPVETNTEILVNYVCGTKLYEESGELVKIKPNSEYPEWLWTLHIGKPKELHELDPNSKEYWQRVRKLGIKTKYRLLSLRQDHRDYK